MADSAVIARLGRDGVTVASVAAVPGGVAMQDVQRSDQPGLDADGRPPGHVSSVLAALSEGLARDVLLVLPPDAAHLSRATVKMPLTGAVTGAAIDEATAQARSAFFARDRAILTCRPFAYAVDGEPSDEAPIGARGGVLTVQAVAALSDMRTLGGFDRTFKQAGLTLAGVVSAPDALVAALLPEGEGVGIAVGREWTVAALASNGTAIAHASVPIGRRHVESDLAQAYALEPAEAARRADAVLAGTSSDDRAIEVAGARLAELSRLLSTTASERDMELAGAALTGLPSHAARQVADATAAKPVGLPKGLQDDPLLGGAAFLALGLRGGLGAATLAEPKPRSWLAWLKARF